MKFTQDYTVRWHDTDANRTVRPSALLVLMQECAGAHLSHFGLSLETLRDRLVAMLWAEHQKQPLDAIALNIHGAAVAVGYPDVEFELLRALRERFGREMPIGMVLDLHGNITEDMTRLADGLFGIYKYPHHQILEGSIHFHRAFH